MFLGFSTMTYFLHVQIRGDIHIIFFLFLHKNIHVCCGYPLEAPSNEYTTCFRGENVSDSEQSSPTSCHSHQVHVIGEKKKCTNKGNDKH